MARFDISFGKKGAEIMRAACRGRRRMEMTHKIFNGQPQEFGGPRKKRTAHSLEKRVKRSDILFKRGFCAVKKAYGINPAFELKREALGPGVAPDFGKARLGIVHDPAGIAKKRYHVVPAAVDNHEIGI